MRRPIPAQLVVVTERLISEPEEKGRAYGKIECQVESSARRHMLDISRLAQPATEHFSPLDR